MKTIDTQPEESHPDFNHELGAVLTRKGGSGFVGGHTPGPWKDSHNGRDDIRIFAESVADSPRCVAKVNTPLNRSLEACANARLIAASPSLYEFVANEARSGNAKAKSTLDSLALSF